jgi:hypothetical protein
MSNNRSNSTGLTKQRMVVPISVTTDITLSISDTNTFYKATGSVALTISLSDGDLTPSGNMNVFTKNTTLPLVINTVGGLINGLASITLQTSENIITISEGTNYTGIYSQNKRNTFSTITASATTAGKSSTIYCNSPSAAITLTLQDADKFVGNSYMIKDISGQATTFPISIVAQTGNIDGSTTPVKIDISNGSLIVVSDGSTWGTF